MRAKGNAVRNHVASMLTRILKASGFGVHPLDQVAWVGRFDQLNSRLLADIARNSIAGSPAELDRRCLGAYLDGTATLARLGCPPVSQLGQDALALGLLGHDGYFVDIGAADPEYLSNTYLLEKHFGWSGLVVEPNPDFAARQRLVRAPGSRTIVREVALGEDEGEASFVMATELSALSSQLDIVDGWQDQRRAAAEQGDVVKVAVVRPGTVLNEAQPPSTIDFLSLDVEGSELMVLRNFPLDRYRIRFACIESNVEADAPRLDELLASSGMVRVLRGFSEQDAWFVNPDLLERA